ncbi:MAG: acyl-CoA dehydrogenase family protein [Chloroflexi bacterium]|nr:acyl-CoA dehydrogenase family protein [Chloroflexota bacterium]
MDFKLDKKQLDFQKEVEHFLKTNVPPGYSEKSLYWPGGYGAILEFEERDPAVDRFRERMYEEGWTTMAWPKELGGGGRSMVEQAIFAERLSYHRAPGSDTAMLIVVPTIMRYGSDEFKKEWIPKIMKGNLRFWLAYSEPNAGSDLSAIQTKAVEDGDDFIVNGQKIWSSGAHISDYGWMVARTDLNVPAHKGTSMFIVDNKTPGITIRPLINIVGFHSFNEVFFDNVRIPKKNLVGEKNLGFLYLMVALDFERLAIAIGGFRRQYEDIVKYAKETKRDGKPISENYAVRKKLADLAIEIEIAYMYFFKTAWMMDNNMHPNIEASVLKLVATQLSRKLAGVGMDVLGMRGQLNHDSPYAPLDGRVCIGYLDSISAVIGAGASEIQRNIIAQRGLGLPRK